MFTNFSEHIVSTELFLGTGLTQDTRLSIYDLLVIISCMEYLRDYTVHTICSLILVNILYFVDLGKN